MGETLYILNTRFEGRYTVSELVLFAVGGVETFFVQGNCFLLMQIGVSFSNDPVKYLPDPPFLTHQSGHPCLAFRVEVPWKGSPVSAAKTLCPPSSH